MRTRNRVTHPVSLKQIILLTGCAFIISCSMMVATIPLHELGHYIMSHCDPDLTVVAFYPFGVPQTHQNDHILTSVLGCVIVKEAYPGAFQHRPVWADLFQEIVCLLIQLVITCFVTLKILTVVMKTSVIQPQGKQRRVPSYT